MTTTTELLSGPNKIVPVERGNQLKMALQVEDVINNGGVAIIEAATGVGKSLAYLIPAFLSGKRVVVSTAKKALQSQLYLKDLPFLEEKIPEIVKRRVTSEATGKSLSVPYTLLKGKSNYVCKLRLGEFLDGENRSSDRWSDNSVEAFRAWSAIHPIGEFGLYDEDVPFEYLVRVNECVAKHCPNLSQCGYQRNKVNAAASKVLVVNHALLAYDLAAGGGKILGQYDALVIDEAHQAAKFFRDAHTVQLTTKQPDQLADMLKKAGGQVQLPPTLKGYYEAVFSSLPDATDRFKPNARLEGALAVIGSQFDELKQGLSKLGVATEDEEGVSEEAAAYGQADDVKSARNLGRLATVARMVSKLQKAVKVLLGHQDEDARTEYLCYTQKSSDRESAPDLMVTPLEVGPLVAPALLHVGRCVLTSATLATADGFKHTLREFGLAESQVRIKEAYPSPFNYRKQSLLYVPPDAVKHDIEKKEYCEKQAAAIHELLAASKGGAFVLCASYEDLNGMYEFVARHHNRANEYAVRRQLSASTIDSDIEWFKSTPRAVLFGAKSLWEGVDVPGLSLRLVIIPRLPFPNWGDVILSSRKKKYVDGRMAGGVNDRQASIESFNEFDLQEMFKDVKQGGGRLIRSEGDWGVVAILDPRACGTAKNYSGKVRACLPMPPSYDRNLAVKFLGILAKNSGVA